jgi:hypothetical protein
MATPRPTTPSSLNTANANASPVIPLPAAMPAPQYDPQSARPALKMIVSGPIDTPQQSSVQVVTSQFVAAPTAVPTAGYNFRGDDMSPSSPSSTPGLQQVATVPNSYVPTRKPFRLATRASQTKALSDPALEGKTLSALGTLMSE